MPWKVATYSGTGRPDPARAAIDTIGICVRPGATVSGEGGTQGANLNMRMVMQDMWLSITEANAAFFQVGQGRSGVLPRAQ